MTITNIYPSTNVSTIQIGSYPSCVDTDTHMHTRKCRNTQTHAHQCKNESHIYSITHKHRTALQQTNTHTSCLSYFPQPLPEHMGHPRGSERERKRTNKSSRLTRFIVSFSSSHFLSTYPLSASPSPPPLTFFHLGLFLPCIAISLTCLCLISPIYWAATSPLALTPHYLLLLSHHCSLSSWYSCFSSPLFSLNLTHHASNHPAKHALFLHHAVPHHGVQRMLNSPVCLEVFYLPVQCLSAVSGNCMKQIEQVEICRILCCLFLFKCRHLHFSG